jgi:hypothetical protein
MHMDALMCVGEEECMISMLFCGSLGSMHILTVLVTSCCVHFQMGDRHTLLTVVVFTAKILISKGWSLPLLTVAEARSRGVLSDYNIMVQSAS